MAVDQFLERAEVVRPGAPDQPAIVTRAGKLGIWEGLHLGTPINN